MKYSFLSMSRAVHPATKSHENTEVKKLYDEYLGEIGGHRAHELLHTDQTKWSLR